MLKKNTIFLLMAVFTLSLFSLNSMAQRKGKKPALAKQALLPARESLTQDLILESEDETELNRNIDELLTEYPDLMAISDFELKAHREGNDVWINWTTDTPENDITHRSMKVTPSMIKTLKVFFNQVYKHYKATNLKEFDENYLVSPNADVKSP